MKWYWVIALLIMVGYGADAVYPTWPDYSCGPSAEYVLAPDGSGHVTGHARSLPKGCVGKSSNTLRNVIDSIAKFFH